MCGGGDNGAAEAARQQTALMEKQQSDHDSAITTGKKSIDDAFSQFTPDYFNNYSKTYRDTYNPQLDSQYGIAKDKLTAILAGGLTGFLYQRDREIIAFARPDLVL